MCWSMAEIGEVERRGGKKKELWRAKKSSTVNFREKPVLEAPKCCHGLYKELKKQDQAVPTMRPHAVPSSANYASLCGAKRCQLCVLMRCQAVATMRPHADKKVNRGSNGRDREFDQPMDPSEPI